MTTNTYKLAEALSEWAFNVAKSVLPNIKVPPTSTMGKMMTLLGINPASYSIYNELGFLVEPSIRAFVAPMVERYVGQLPDEQIPDIARMYAGAFRKRAAERGYVDVFGVQLGEQSFVRLEELFNQKFGKNERDNQEIRGAVRDDGDLGRYE
ncbi:MAG: hypothetical protein IIX12_08195 [Alistipes sp.]|nr:hypothetical protein [Alistipes sp.]